MAEAGRRHPPVLVRMLTCAVAAGVAAASLVPGLLLAPPQTGAAPPPVPELPLGGREIFPAYRVVAFHGHPHADGLGALGIGTPKQAVRRLLAQARHYARPSRPVLPALALIATVAQRSPGRDGMFRKRTAAAIIDRYLQAARRARALLLLDIQPGRSDFVRELRRLRPWLAQPDVGVALDPEWRVPPGRVPGRVVGSVSASEVNAVSAELARIVATYDLPEKLFVLHQFRRTMLRDEGRIARRRGLATVISHDGIGTRRLKVAEYHAMAERQRRFFNGIKLFYREDRRVIRPATIMALRPPPDLVFYE